LHEKSCNDQIGEGETGGRGDAAWRQTIARVVPGVAGETGAWLVAVLAAKAR